MQLQQQKTRKKKSKPARILRPGAETKVGGSPLITIGFKAISVLWLLLLLSTSKEEEQETEKEVGVSLREWKEGGGIGNELR